MPIEIGHVEAIFRYPVKSMGGERLDAANLGWHGLDGDRRLAFRRIDDLRSGSQMAGSTVPAGSTLNPLDLSQKEDSTVRLGRSPMDSSSRPFHLASSPSSNGPSAL
jgi:uncharacterized protein YcbX